MKIVIYTALFEDFDILLTPKVVNSKIKYICFSDKKINVYPWEVIVVKRKFKNPRLENRMYKILSHRFLEDFDISIYIDANYTILDDLSKYVEDWLGPNDIALQKHKKRNCIYKEMKQCITKLQSLTPSEKTIIRKQIENYRKEGFPENYGLTDNSFIIRRHTEKIKELNELWWKQIITYSIRDQLSLMYVLYKLKIDYSIIPIPNQRKPNTKFLDFRPHLHNINNRFFLQKIIDEMGALKYVEFGNLDLKFFLSINIFQKNLVLLKLPEKSLILKNLFNLKHILYYFIKKGIKCKIKIYYKNKLFHSFKNRERVGIYDIVFFKDIYDFKKTLINILKIKSYVKKNGIIIINGGKNIHLIKNSKEIKKQLTFFKIMTYIRAFIPDLTSYTLDLNNYLGIILKSKNSEKLNLDKNTFNNLNINDFLNNMEAYLGLKPPQFFNDLLILIKKL
ncbi:MAG: glycosyltransferase domain-containing protein [Promethearchaeia archaeon]